MRVSGAKWLKQLLLLMAMVTAQWLTVSPAHAQHTSTECPPQTATVSSGGTVTIDVTDCAVSSAFFGGGVVDGGTSPPDFPDHGSAVFRINGSRWFIDYSHNGSTGIGSTDVFEFTDGTIVGNDVRVTVSINASASPISVAPGSLATMTAGTATSQTLTATGGLSPYTYTLQSGALPAGLSLSSAGLLSGTPTQRGAYSFSVRATDSTAPTAQFVDKGYTGNIQDPTLALSPSNFSLIQNVAASFSLTASGGVPPYTYLVEPSLGNALPPGLSLSLAGVVSGTPTSSGTFNTTIRVGDSSTGPGQILQLRPITINVLASPPTVSIAVSPASVSEDGATNLVYTVTRSVSLATSTVVNLTTGGTATAGTDYTGNVATVTIPAGATTATVTIDPTVDTLAEVNETVTLTVAAGTGYTVGAPASATGTINNDDVVQASISVSPATVAEDGAANLVYTVTLSATSATPTSVNFTVGGTATSGTDYAAVTSPLVIAAGSTTGTITVDPTADGTIEPDETVIMTLAAGTGYTVGTPNAATGTIQADEALTFTVSPAALNAMTAGDAFTQALSASGGTGPYSFSIDAGALPTGLTLAADGTISGTPTRRGAYSVTVRVQDSLGAIGGRTFTGTVLNPTIVTTPTTLTLSQNVPANVTFTSTGGVPPYRNFEVISGTLPAGLTLATSGTISGTPTTLGSSTMTVRRSDSSTPGTLFQNFSLTINIVNLPSVSVAVSPSSTSEDGAGNLVYTVTRDIVTASPLTVNLTTTGGATSGTDYSGAVASVTIPANAASATVTIDPAADSAIEANETVVLTIAPDAAYVVGTPSSATGTIANDDFPTASIAVAPASVLEDGAPNLIYTVTLSQAAFSPVSVNFTVGGTASPGNDFSGLALSPLVFAPGVTSQTLTVDPSSNGSIEPDETVIISLGAGTGYVVGAPADATGTITNDDFPNISVNNVTVTEGDSGTTNAVFTVSLTAAAPGAVTFDIATATNGSATSGQDYVANSQTGVTIPAGSTSATFTVAINGDALNEANETFFVNLTNASGAIINGSQGTGTITNDDPLPTLSIGNVTRVEGNLGGGANVNFAVTLDAPSGQIVRVDFATANGSATAGSDYVAVASGLVFGAGETVKQIQVQVNADTIPEADEQFTVSLSNAVNAVIGTGTGTGTIINDDVPLTIAPGVMPAGGVGTAYSQTLTTSGGTGPYSYTVTAGTLPTGLTLGTGGLLSGTPVAAGNFNFTVTTTDSSGAPGPYSSSQAYTVSIAVPTIVVTPTTLPNATYGEPYSESLSASGSVGPYSFAVTSGALPQGITLAADGTLSGTPTLGGQTGFTITATDSTPTGYAGARAYTFTVDVPPLVLPSTTLPAGGTDIPYGAQIPSAFGGVAPYTYALAPAPLPPGLTMSSSGAISGTPTAAGVYNFAVVATDSNAGTGPSLVQQNYSITITNTPPLANPVSATIPFNAGLTPITLDVSGRTTHVSVATQPTHGRAVASGMTISYVPDSGYAGPDSFTYIARNLDASSAPATVTITVAGPTITLTPAGPLTANIGSPYNQTLTFNGGTQPFTNYQVTGLPSGLQIGSTGAARIEIVGTPTVAGSFPLTITATDASTGNGPFTVTRSVTLNVDGPNLVLTPGSGGFTVAFDAPLSQGIVASGGIGGYSYAVTAGSLPTGIALDGATGLLSGRTTSVGTFNFTVTATDNGASGAGAPFVVSGNYALTVSPPVIVFDQTSLPAATVAAPYSATISASGGISPYGYAVTAGALPAGVTLSGGGVLSGTPTAGGSFTFTVTATDASSAPGPFSASRAFTLSVGAPSVVLPATVLASGQAGTAYSAALNPASGGIAPYSYAVTGGALPTGIGLSASGTLSGTPTAFGSFAFTVTATDSSTGAGPYSAAQGYTLVIVAETPVANSVSASVAYGSSNNPIALSIGGGAATSVAVASAPANGSATANGTTIVYTPNASFSGVDSFTYTATNGGGTSAPATVTITIGAPTLSVSASGPLTATVGVPYSQTFSFAGGTAPFGSHQVAGLPAGLALTGTTANSVTISGTPRSQGTFTLSVSASDSSTGNGPFIANQSFTLTVAAPNLAIAPAAGSFAAGYATPFSQSFAASGGIGPYSYALGGTLPAGVTLNTSTGTVSGTPTAPGSFAFTVTATDTGATGAGAPFTAQGSYTLAVAVPNIAVTPATLPNATAGTAYSATLAGSGAIAPYSFSLASGALPAGVTLSATGTLSGTPTASGSFPFIVALRDANGQTGTASLTLIVNVPTLVIGPPTLPAAIQGIAYNQTITASGGVAPYRFAVSAGSLPAGLALNTTTGAISGTPTGSGTATFSITVTDSTTVTAAAATIAYVVQVTARPDPAKDPEVRGLVKAQVMASRRFADAQVNNFMRRLEALHGTDGGGANGGGFQSNLRISMRGYCEDSLTAWTSDLCQKSESKFGPVASANGGSEQDGTTDGTGTVVTRDLPMTVWAGGTIRFGDRDPSTGRLAQEFESEGISFGADYRFSPHFAAGVGVGLGRDTVDIGENGSQSQGEAKTVAIYGSHQLGGGIYADWLGGYQWLDFDLRRYVTSTGALVNSHRTGRQWFVTGSVGGDIETGNWLITPYARLDLTRGTLNGYSENSGSLFDLAFLDQDVKFTSLGIGTRVNYRHAFRGGTLLPRLRLEYLYDLESNADAQVTYRDIISGPFSTIALSGLSREQLMLGLGVELQLESALSFELEYLNRIAAGSGSDQAVQVGVSVKF